MQITIKSKNIELTASLENVIMKRMSGFEKLIEKLHESSELLVEIERETKHHLKGNIFSVKSMVNVPGANLVARAHGEDLIKAVTEVKNELDRVIRKYKTKTIEAPRRKYRRTLPKTQGK